MERPPSCFSYARLAAVSDSVRRLSVGLSRLLNRREQRFMWKPLSENKLAAMIEEAELFMSPGCLKFWDYIKVRPQKWSLSPQGDEGGGFWVVAVCGRTCIYYNDIEEGFNLSSWESFGRIDRYGCNQSDLLETMGHFHLQFSRDIKSDA